MLQIAIGEHTAKGKQQGKNGPRESSLDIPIFYITYYGEVSTFGFHQTQKKISSTCSDRQQDCSLSYSKNGRYRKSSSYIDSKRNIEFPNEKLDHDYCRIPAEQTKCDGRLGIPEPLGFKHLEVRTPSNSDFKSTSMRFLP